MNGTALASGPLVRSGTAALASVNVGQFRKLSGPTGVRGRRHDLRRRAVLLRGGLSAAGDRREQAAACQQATDDERDGDQRSSTHADLLLRPS